jgi:hypothetical protein
MGGGVRTAAPTDRNRSAPSTPLSAKRLAAGSPANGQPNERWCWMTVEEETIKTLGPQALCLATLLAHHATLRDAPNPRGLALGEAFLGWGRNWFKSGHQFRGARKRLEQRGYAGFRLAERGWVGRLNDGRLFRIFSDAYYEDNNTEQGR